jgi:hypothetical protein
MGLKSGGAGDSLWPAAVRLPTALLPVVIKRVGDKALVAVPYGDV